MNRQKWIMMAVALVLIAGAAGVLSQHRLHQKLGLPGVKTHPVPGSNRLEVELPAEVLDFKSEVVEVDKMVMEALPQDTSFGQRRYKAADGFQTLLNVVLMGSDRTSLHKPQFCLEGAGWHIDAAASSETVVHIEKPIPYDLPVVKLVATKEATVEGRKVRARGVYVYWFVADNALSAGIAGYQRMWWMARELVRTGVLQRWAYVTCFAICDPGQEDATFERMKSFIAAAVPDFQLTPSAASQTATVRP